MTTGAERLQGLLDAGRAVADGNPATLRWAEVFKLDTTEHNVAAETLRRGAEMIELAADVRRRASSLPNMPPYFLDHFDKIERCVGNFQQVGAARMTDFMQPYDDLAQQSLGFLHYALSHDDPEFMPSDEERNALSRRVEALMHEVNDSKDLDPDTRHAVAVRLNEIMQLLATMPQRGVEPVRAAVNVLIGEVIVQVADDSLNRRQPNPLFKRVVHVLAGVAVVLAGSVSDAVVGPWVESGGPQHLIESVTDFVVSDDPPAS